MRRPRAAGHFRVTPRARRLASASALARRGRPVSRRERIGCWALTASRGVGRSMHPRETEANSIIFGAGARNFRYGSRGTPFLRYWILHEASALGPAARHELAI